METASTDQFFGIYIYIVYTPCLSNLMGTAQLTGEILKCSKILLGEI